MQACYCLTTLIFFFAIVSYRALYGQALADQERTALLQINSSSRSGSQKLLSAASADSISNDNIDGGKGGGNVAGTARHPFAPQQVCILCTSR